jgi:hypothetical protein
MVTISKERARDALTHILSVLFIFTVMIAYFYMTFFRGNSLFIDKYDQITIYNQSEHHSCHITLTEPTIIIRMDDVRAYSYPTKYVVDEVLSKNMSIVLGVIPEDIEKDVNMRKYLISLKNNPKVEIAQHGVNHDEGDLFVSEDQIIHGSTLIQENIGVQPVTYIPPYNKIDDSVLLGLEKHFKLISSAAPDLKEGEIAFLGQTVQNYDYELSQEVNMDNIIDGCKRNIEMYNFCVVTIHPQEYSSDINHATDISKEKMVRLDNMLKKLKKLNASSTTFNNIVQCYED